ncbi:hypothetical protein AOC36_01325 [Erysipelothrix larvae]|uniref:non-specific protein-tyrosine kinase n=1 Tax=Erysipelothrix larvae TaxID=1514105 RepID=A0A0X8GYC0_9FIRM|nr:CpsD/CapB family tyrosine-protein kinase [Erysipelothrix larvae]AMC92679.1 hypothetical protein AOC36_01325 [Erysipelothrix larvae]
MISFKKRNKQVKKNKTYILSNKSPFAYLEGYKSLRTNLSFLTFSGEVKTILVTSSVPNEGKSTVSINVARTLSMAGHKVLLIDADLRAPVIQKYLNVNYKITSGLSSVLASKAQIKDAIYKSPSLEMDVIFSGPIPPNAVELLSRDRAKTSIETLRKRYDYIIIDSPPAGVVTDSVVLSQHVDGVLYVVRQNHAEKELVKNAMKDLVSMEANILGIIFNDYIDERSKRKGSRDKYSYYYQSGNK